MKSNASYMAVDGGASPVRTSRHLTSIVLGLGLVMSVAAVGISELSKSNQESQLWTASSTMQVGLFCRIRG